MDDRVTINSAELGPAPAPLSIEPDDWKGEMYLAAGPGYDVESWPAREVSRLSRDGWFYESEYWHAGREYFVRTRYRTGTEGTVYCYDEAGTLTHLYRVDDNVRMLVRAV